MPPAICALPALTALDMSNNKLSAIPDALGGAACLKRLMLENNKIAV